MAKEILTDDGQLEEVDMDEAKGKSKNKELGLPAIDDEEGREDSEPDGEEGTKKKLHPKLKSLMLLQKLKLNQRKKKMTKITKMTRKMMRKK